MRRVAHVTTCVCPAEALEILDSDPHPIVISDYRMDRMSGSEFLGRVRDAHPDTIRILVTAHSDFDG